MVRWLFTIVGRLVVGRPARGMDIDGEVLDLSACSLLALLVNVAATLWAAGVAMRLRTMQAGPVMQMPVFLLLFLAPVYVPLALLDGLAPRGGDREPVTTMLERPRLLAGARPTSRWPRVRLAVGLLLGPGSGPFAGCAARSGPGG